MIPLQVIQFLAKVEEGGDVALEELPVGDCKSESASDMDSGSGDDLDKYLSEMIFLELYCASLLLGCPVCKWWHALMCTHAWQHMCLRHAKPHILNYTATAPNVQELAQATSVWRCAGTQRIVVASCLPRQNSLQPPRTVGRLLPLSITIRTPAM